MADHAALEKNLDEVPVQVKELTAVADNAKLHYQLRDKRIMALEKDLRLTKEKFEKDQVKTLKDLKLSAYKSVLQAKIQMVEDVGKPDFTPSSWDLEGWKAKLAKLVAVEPECSDAGQADAVEEQVVELEVPVVVGDEGKDAET